MVSTNFSGVSSKAEFTDVLYGHLSGISDGSFHLGQMNEHGSDNNI